LIGWKLEYFVQIGPGQHLILIGEEVAASTPGARVCSKGVWEWSSILKIVNWGTSCCHACLSELHWQGLPVGSLQLLPDWVAVECGETTFLHVQQVVLTRPLSEGDRY